MKMTKMRNDIPTWCVSTEQCICSDVNVENKNFEVNLASEIFRFSTEIDIKLKNEVLTGSILESTVYEDEYKF